jgi:hypothetical protein
MNEEIEDYFNTLPTKSTSIIIDQDSKMIKENQTIIDQANKLLIERLRYGDDSLRPQDIASMKSDAFKQNQTLKGLGEDEIDVRKLIPTTINIQIINN